MQIVGRSPVLEPVWAHRNLQTHVLYAQYTQYSLAKLAKQLNRVIQSLIPVAPSSMHSATHSQLTPAPPLPREAPPVGLGTCIVHLECTRTRKTFVRISHEDFLLVLLGVCDSWYQQEAIVTLSRPIDDSRFSFQAKTRRIEGKASTIIPLDVHVHTRAH